MIININKIKQHRNRFTTNISGFKLKIFLKFEFFLSQTDDFFYSANFIENHYCGWICHFNICNINLFVLPFATVTNKSDDNIFIFLW